MPYTVRQLSFGGINGTLRSILGGLESHLSAVFGAGQELAGAMMDESRGVLRFADNRPSLSEDGCGRDCDFMILLVKLVSY